MSICTFFGHRLCPATLEAELRSVLRDLIEYHGVDTFYIGNQGAFDGMALAVLRELAHLYPQITYTVVLAYRTISTSIQFLDYERSELTLVFG